MVQAALQKGMEPFPGYNLRQPLGQGGFGQVWEARTRDNQLVALKFLPVRNEKATPQELRSIQAVRQLPHPHLIHIDRVWCQPGYIVVSMEVADASVLDLLHVYQREFNTPVPAEHAYQLLSQAAEAIDFLNAPAHQLGGCRCAIQHRDVKPSNLLLFGDTVKLTDFGTAALLTTTVASCSPAGTVDYAAPEMFQGRVTDRTDQYALAVTYCQLRTAQLPFGDSPERFDRGYVRSAPDLSLLPARERPPILRALAPAAHQRWPSCAVFMEQIARVLF